ncbi:MAG: hypothetical protein AAF296_06355 [Pseudomonadota bacterium]
MNKTEQAIRLSSLLQQEMGRSFPFILVGPEKMLTATNNPDAPNIRPEVDQVLAGALIVYLFAIWDQYVTHADVDQFFRPDEKVKFFAFKHLRIVAAHNINGDRTGNRNGQDRMDHAEKLDKVMGSAKPLAGVALEANKVVLTLPHAVLECRQFLQDMALKLPLRYAAGGPAGKVRGTDGQEHDVL